MSYFKYIIKLSQNFSLLREIKKTNFEMPCWKYEAPPKLTKVMWRFASIAVLLFGFENLEL